MAVLQGYRKALQHEHGWEVELTCTDCSHTGLPQYDGWEPDNVINIGNTPTMFARVSCANCGRDLRSVAGEKLVAMFSEITVPKANRRIIAWFVVACVCLATLPLAAQFILKPSFPVASLGVILVLPLIFVFNYRVASMRKRCPCGAPRYVLMGLLGRSYCYRCSSCGNLLRLRD